MNPRWLATCPEDTKGVLLAELVALGVASPMPIYGGVSFSADLALAYRAHLCLRTASRIQRILAELPADSAEGLGRAAQGLPWADWLRPQQPFTVQPSLADADARALGEAAVASAIANAASGAFTPPLRHSSDPATPTALVAHLRHGRCTLGLDTAGRALHKRGWRVNGHPAVLKETLAAAILMLAGYTGEEPLYDPMCGSGTLLVEAAYIALGKAPLIHRSKGDFGFEHHAGFDRALWRTVSDAVRAERRSAPPMFIGGSELRPEFVGLARQGALRARVEKHLSLSVSRVQDTVAPAERGLVVANLPYGERIGRGEIDALYADTGRVIRERFRGWRFALLVPATAPKAALQLPVAREVSLRNGALEVRLLLGG